MSLRGTRRLLSIQATAFVLNQPGVLLLISRWNMMKETIIVILWWEFVRLILL